ncbi:hypothetical protein CAOG_04323 [Capsaspora owczarzaki ATCC 30864]|uniref:DUF1279 domain-containing protein n=1 Tax=Capsaspora owczarzaki (strain ATCC 30864) TaxID=595528 RepID=A0A0D2WR12_CAPO3|nr:hypothetical protein CAOG_04323 [Capsaspora owczarzaki ATCC 30864]KJE93553.1 hypothetical protein CAOG_004323 [Capsaspora owczarzaki ATCC 30864]|eukprot:XP_004348151.1 hypothetical protein CAOG_04323 [Capsaspora owczarzaki ATCC 30864]
MASLCLLRARVALCGQSYTCAPSISGRVGVAAVTGFGLQPASSSTSIARSLSSSATGWLPAAAAVARPGSSWMNARVTLPAMASKPLAQSHSRGLSLAARSLAAEKPASATSSTSTSGPDAATSAKPPKEESRFRRFVREYGRVGLVTLIAIDLVTYAAVYAALSFGVDIPAVFDYLGIEHAWFNPNAGQFVVAYAVYKVTAPLRWGFALGVTPAIVSKLRSMGWIETPPPSPPSPPSSS